MNLWYHLAKLACNDLFVERPEMNKKAKEFQKMFDSKILKYIYNKWKILKK